MYVDGTPTKRKTQDQRRAATRRALIAAGRELFATFGYTQTSTEAIVARAAVTRGALYHHFGDKRDLFRAVVEEIEREIDGRVGAVAKDQNDPATRFLAGIDAFLDACLVPDVKQILLLDGPSVLGWQEWQAIDAQHALVQIEAGVTMLIESGQIADQPIRPLARLIHGALIAAALTIAGNDDPPRARAEMGAALVRLLNLRSASNPRVPDHEEK